MKKCDLLKAVEAAALRYLARLLINRIGKHIGKRAIGALITFLLAALADGPSPVGDVIGLLIAIGVGIWSLYEAATMMYDIVSGFRDGIWQSFKKIPEHVLDAPMFDCLDRKERCCQLFQAEIQRLLDDALNSLRPGWKQKSPWTGGLRWRQIVKDMKNALKGPLAECCATP